MGQEAGGREDLPNILGNVKSDHEVRGNRTGICKARSLEKGNTTSVTCEIFHNCRQFEHRTSANFFLLFVVAPLSETLSHLKAVPRPGLLSTQSPPSALVFALPNRRKPVCAKAKRTVGFYFQIFQL